MQFKYFYKMEAMGEIEIEDIGNFCLSLTNDFYKEFILIVKTELGRTKIIQYGPINVDMETPCSNINYTYDEMDFSKYKIERIVDKALNGKSMISQATLIELEDAISKIKSMVEFL